MQRELRQPDWSRYYVNQIKGLMIVYNPAQSIAKYL